MTDNEGGPGDNRSRSISNTMGMAVIAVLLLQGVIIGYNHFRLQTALTVLNMLIPHIKAPTKE